MTRAQLEHVIRAAAANADCADIVIVGSQAILGSVPEPRAPALKRSVEADVFPRDDPGRAILIDGAMGERSVFHETFGYYAHGVGEETAVLPPGWRERLVPVRNENTRGCTGWCLAPEDLAVSKLFAGRTKDLEFLRALFEEGIVRRDAVARLAAEVEGVPEDVRALAQERLAGMAAD